MKNEKTLYPCEVTFDLSAYNDDTPCILTIKIIESEDGGVVEGYEVFDKTADGMLNALTEKENELQVHDEGIDVKKTSFSFAYRFTDWPTGLKHRPRIKASITPKNLKELSLMEDDTFDAALESLFYRCQHDVRDEFAKLIKHIIARKED